MMISNSKYYIKSTITSTQADGTTFLLSTDFELGANLETAGASVSMVLKSGTQIERFEISATGGVATIVKRGLTQSGTETESVGLKKQWTDGTIAYVTALAFDIFDKQGDTMTGNLAFSGTTFAGVKVNNLTTAQRTALTPTNGEIVYDTNLQEFYSGKNGAWTPLGTGSGGGAIWSKDSTEDATLTGAINGSNTVYTLSTTPGSVNSTFVYLNGQLMERAQDYNISGTTLTFTFAPTSGKIVVIYPDVAPGVDTASTRATTDAAAINGELYRSTDNSQSLYYKDNGGDTIKLVDISTNKIPQSSTDFEFASQSEAGIGSNNTKLMTPLRVKQSTVFAGTGVDGTQGDANLTITGSNNTVITKEFSSWAAGSVARTATITPTGGITLIKIQGDADFTNWTFDWSGKGMPGGAGGAGNPNQNTSAQGGSAGSASVASTLTYTSTAPTGGVAANNNGAVNATGPGGGGAGGGSGANLLNLGAAGSAGTAGQAQGAGGTAGSYTDRLLSMTTIQYMKYIRMLVPQGGGGGQGGGAGGHNGGASTAGVGGAGGTGGAGGGILIIQVGGNLTLNSGNTVFNMNGGSSVGTVGGAATLNIAAGGGGGGGGGGGAGGFLCVFYGGAITGTTTPTVAGGTSAGGTGGAGIGGGGSGTTGSAGGTGGTGGYIIEKNIAF